MTCDKAFKIDLAAFVVDATAPEFTEFREHYPRCQVCSAEVQAWTELHAQLEAGGGMKNGSHPDEHLLLQFERQPNTLPSAQRESIERHLSTCHSCRDELQALRSFDFTALEQVARKPRRRWLHRIAGLGSVARGVVLHPAFAYGLVILLLLPTVIGRFSIPDSRSPSEQAAVRDEGPEVVLERAEDSFALSADAPSRKRWIAAKPSFESTSRVAPPPERSATGPPAREERGGSDIVRFGGEISQWSLSHRREAAPPAEATRQRAFAGASGHFFEATGKPAAPRWSTTVLVGGEPLEISKAGLDEGLTLKIPLPQESGRRGDVEVRVLDPDRRRELRERVAAPAGAHYVEVGVPAAWLSPGRYRVELHVAGIPRAELRHLWKSTFTVRERDPEPEVRRFPDPSISEGEPTRSRPSSQPQ